MGKFLKLKEVYCEPDKTHLTGYASPIDNITNGLFVDVVRYTKPRKMLIPKDQILAIQHPVTFGYEPDCYAEWGDKDDVPIPGVWFDDATAIWVKHPVQTYKPEAQCIYVCHDIYEDILDQFDD